MLLKPAMFSMYLQWDLESRILSKIITKNIMPTLQIPPKHKRNIYKILPFGFLWAIFGIIYSLIEKGLIGNLDYYPSTGNSYDFTAAIIIITILTTATGLILGAIEILFLSRYFSQRSFGAKIFIKTCFPLGVISITRLHTD